MAHTNSNPATTSMMESLEERQLFSHFGTVNISLTDITPAAQVDYTRLSVDQSWSAGQFYWTRNAANPGTYNNKNCAKSMTTFCIEPDQDVVDQVATYQVSLLSDVSCGAHTGPLSTAKSDAIRELWARFYGTIGNDGTKAAAFQMSIWEIVCDNDKNLSTGTFSVDNTTATDVAVKKQAQCWLNQINGRGPKANLLALTSPTNQDQIFEENLTPSFHTCNHVFDFKQKWHCFSTGSHSCLDKGKHC
jgi:hypothetical protein